MNRLLWGLLLALIAGAAVAGESAVDTVRRLYRDFAWEAVLETSAGRSFVDQPQQRLRSYLSAGLSAALRAERACVARRGEICALDFAPLWGSQDPVAIDLRISAVAGAPSRVLVSFNAVNESHRRELVLHLRRESVGWRVDDIEYPGGQRLRQLLGSAR